MNSKAYDNNLYCLYQEILNSFTKEHGVPLLSKEGESISLSGSFCRLLDFDNDGVEELYLAYTDCLEIYTIINSKVVQIYQDPYFNPFSMDNPCLVYHDNITSTYGLLSFTYTVEADSAYYIYEKKVFDGNTFCIANRYIDSSYTGEEYSDLERIDNFSDPILIKNMEQNQFGAVKNYGYGYTITEEIQNSINDSYLKIMSNKNSDSIIQQENATGSTIVKNKQATSGQCGDSVFWELDEATGELIISGDGDMWNYDYPLYGNPAPWIFVNDMDEKTGKIFHFENNIQKIFINKGVTSIGTRAFAYAENLTYVDIPNTMISIGAYAFHDCQNLKEITIPQSVKIIGECAFGLQGTGISETNDAFIVYGISGSITEEYVNNVNNSERYLGTMVFSPLNLSSFARVHYSYLKEEHSNYLNKDFYAVPYFKDIINTITYDMYYGELNKSYQGHITSDFLSLQISSMLSNISEQSNIDNLTTIDIYTYILAQIITGSYSDENITSYIKNNISETCAIALSGRDVILNNDLWNVIERLDLRIAEANNIKDICNILGDDDFSEAITYINMILDHHINSNYADENAQILSNKWEIIYKSLNDISVDYTNTIKKMIKTASDNNEYSNDLYKSLKKINDAISTTNISSFIDQESERIRNQAIQNVQDSFSEKVIGKTIEKILEKIFTQLGSPYFKLTKLAGDIIGFQVSITDKIQKVTDEKLYIASFNACAHMHSLIYQTIEDVECEPRTENNAMIIHNLLNLYKSNEITAMDYSCKYEQLFDKNNISFNPPRDLYNIVDSMFFMEKTAFEHFNDITGYSSKKEYQSKRQSKRMEYEQIIQKESLDCNYASLLLDEMDNITEKIVDEIENKINGWISVIIACPVSVDVYKNNELHKSISVYDDFEFNCDYSFYFNILNEVDSDGNEKSEKAIQIIYPDSEEYYLKINALDSGEMSVISYEYLVNTDEIKDLFFESEISINKGQTYLLSFNEDKCNFQNTDDNSEITKYDSNDIHLETNTLTFLKVIFIILFLLVIVIVLISKFKKIK